jgi:hypothetical protein
VRKSHSNLFFGNAVERQVTPNGVPFGEIFSAGGSSWEVWPPRRENPS